MKPELVYLNHGTVGAPPRRVLETVRGIRNELESNPVGFLVRALPDRLRQARQRVAGFLGARAEDLVFVDNVSAAVNGVLRSLALESGDGIAITSLTYGGVAAAAKAVAKQRNLMLHEVVLPFPVAHPDDVVNAFAKRLPPDTRLAIVDHVTADTSLVLPIADIAELCRERGTTLLVDGAHAPGMLPLDIQALGADIYVANLHKWLWAPRPCGVLWARPELQDQVRPAVASWGYDQSFHAAFEWVGTKDPSPFLAAPEAITMFEEVGPDAVRTYNHDLVWAGGNLLADRWGTARMAPESMVGAMMAVALPKTVPRTPGAVAAWLAHLHARGFEVSGATNGTEAWVRVAAQVYNELDDFVNLAEAAPMVA
ncbi:MAG: aminotransferase class V-fold PLP-dependent enzyme [Myxococcota bacterium]